MAEYRNRNNFIFMLMTILVVGGYWFAKKKFIPNANPAKAVVDKLIKQEGKPLDLSDGETQQNLIVKLNLYVDCLNRNSDRARESLKRYGSWVKDLEQGPTGKETYPYGLYTIYGKQYYCDKVGEADEVKPALPVLEAKAATYVKSLDELDAIIKKADKYYERQDWKDDAFAKGKQLHPQLMAAFKQFFEAEEAVRVQIDSLSQLLPLKDNAQLAVIYGELTALLETMQKPVAFADLQGHIQRIERAMQELEADAEMEEMANQTDNALRPAKELMRALRDKKKMDSWQREDYERQFGRGISQWIDSYNGLANTGKNFQVKKLHLK